jgi:hypothetical protein
MSNRHAVSEPVPTAAATGRRLRVVQVLPKPTGLTETFLRANATYLPADVTIVHSWIPSIGEHHVLSQRLAARAVRKLSRAFKRQPWEREITHRTARHGRPARRCDTFRSRS